MENGILGGSIKVVVKNVEGGDSRERKNKHFWVAFKSEKYKKFFTFLHEDKKFETTDEAKEYAINWIDTYVKKTKTKQKRYLILKFCMHKKRNLYMNY
ncbi:hypothetical protein [Bacillus mycoides]|uniref:Uncharacterized protein n=1 Tax=Bacillus mycoides TaxID=1405 RepID=A0ABC9QWK3_BACMY|nr:hypothetical protein [Bacillus mycoides]EJR32150.1 hypothetical protein III_05209 [Bacillus mycoides]